MHFQHGLDLGVEMGFHSRQASFVATVTALLDQLADNATFEFVPDATQAEMAEGCGRKRGQ